MSSLTLTAVRSFGKFSISSLSSSIVDLTAFSLLCTALVSYLPESAAIIVATIIARILSSLCNYLVNYFFVFHSHTSHSRSVSLYTVITVLKTLASALLVAGAAALLPVAIPELAIKIPVDVALFFLNYLLQKTFVY